MGDSSLASTDNDTTITNLNLISRYYKTSTTKLALKNAPESVGFARGRYTLSLSTTN